MSLLPDNPNRFALLLMAKIRSNTKSIINENQNEAMLFLRKFAETWYDCMDNDIVTEVSLDKKFMFTGYVRITSKSKLGFNSIQWYKYTRPIGGPGDMGDFHYLGDSKPW